MRGIRSRGNATTEMRLSRILRKHRIIGWRRHLPVEGRPDFVFPVEKVAVFVDGCFWHGCVRCCTSPKHNSDYWEQKIAAIEPALKC
jgi:DNA mismatch endonuclease (patch repair protein)